MEYKELKTLLNKGLSALIISAIFIIVGLCFIPLTVQTLIDGTEIFLPASFEAIFMYILLGVGLIFLIFGTINLVKYFKNKPKKQDK